MVGSTTWRNGEPCQCPAAASAPSPPPTNNDDPLIGFALKVVYYFGSYQTFHESLADLNLFKEKTESGTNPSTGPTPWFSPPVDKLPKRTLFSRLWDDFIAAYILVDSFKNKAVEVPRGGRRDSLACCSIGVSALLHLTLARIICSWQCCRLLLGNIANDIASKKIFISHWIRQF